VTTIISFSNPLGNLGDRLWQPKCSNSSSYLGHLLQYGLFMDGNESLVHSP